MEKLLVIILLVTVLATLPEAWSVQQTDEAKAFWPKILRAESVFETGELATTSYEVKKSDPTSPPKPLFIVTPIINGTYPIVLFHHGTYLQNDFYSILLELVASHGYVVVAPQYYDLIIPSGEDELESSVEVANWLSTGLDDALPGGVYGNLDKIALAGHSRGGKLDFALALGYAKSPLQVNFSALIGVDPVEGASKNDRIKPYVLTYVPDSLNLSIPVEVIGTGLGSEGRTIYIPMPIPVPIMLPACAPNEVNHREFYNESRSPKSHFVATNYGHMDMLNDDLPGVLGSIADNLCKNGKGSRDVMRRTVSGLIVSFLKASLEGDDGDYMAILENPSLAPAELNPVQYSLGAQNHALYGKRAPNYALI